MDLDMDYDSCCILVLHNATDVPTPVETNLQSFTALLLSFLPQLLDQLQLCLDNHDEKPQQYGQVQVRTEEIPS